MTGTSNSHRVACAEHTVERRTLAAAEKLMSEIDQFGACRDLHTVEVHDGNDWVPRHIWLARRILSAKLRDSVETFDGQLVLVRGGWSVETAERAAAVAEGRFPGMACRARHLRGRDTHRRWAPGLADRLVPVRPTTTAANPVRGVVGKRQSQSWVRVPELPLCDPDRLTLRPGQATNRRRPGTERQTPRKEADMQAPAQHAGNVYEVGETVKIRYSEHTTRTLGLKVTDRMFRAARGDYLVTFEVTRAPQGSFYNKGDTFYRNERDIHQYGLMHG